MDIYKLETHLHTKGNSSCAHEKCEDIIKIYKNAGYDGIVCTNHFNSFIMEKYLQGSDITERLEIFLQGFYELKKIGKEQNVDVFFGLELALNKDHYHKRYKLFCAELLIYGITVEEFLKDNIKIYKMTYKELYNYAEQKGWLIIQAHPYRLRSKRINHRYLHGIEVFNGHPWHISFNTLALRRAKKYNLIKTAGSDFHFKGGENSGIICQNRIKDEKHLVEMLRLGNYNTI